MRVIIKNYDSTRAKDIIIPVENNMDKHVDFSGGYVVLNDTDGNKVVYVDFMKYHEVTLDL